MNPAQRKMLKTKAEVAAWSHIEKAEITADVESCCSVCKQKITPEFAASRGADLPKAPSTGRKRPCEELLSGTTEERPPQRPQPPKQKPPAHLLETPEYRPETRLALELIERIQ